MLAKGALAASQELPPAQRVAFGHTMLKKLESTNRRFDQEKRYCRIQGLAVAIKGDSGQDRWSKRKVASKVTYRSKPGARVAQFSFATRWLDLSFPHVIGGVQKSTLENRCTGQVPKLSLKPQSGPSISHMLCLFFTFATLSSIDFEVHRQLHRSAQPRIRQLLIWRSCS